MTLNTLENPKADQVCGISLAHVFKSAGDTLRLDILRVLNKASFGVQELAHIFSVPQPGMSHHLKVLAKAGLIVSRREGTSLFYRRPLIHENSPIKDLLHSLFVTVDHIELSDEIKIRIEKIYQDRGSQSRDFFTKNAEDFAENQGRIVSFKQYASAAEDLITQTKAESAGLALEIGPGQGELLVYLASQFDKVIALDNSPDMLDKSKYAAKKHSLENISFIQGELDQIVEKNLSIDVLALNMVLHHMPSPPDAFTTFKKVLNPNGALFIAELCHHDQEWVKESCGDIWLGFHPDELDEWAKTSGFKLGNSQYIGMKNGFQVQLKTFFNIDNPKKSLHI